MKAIISEIKDYLCYCEMKKKLSSNTMRAYRIDMQQFINYLLQCRPSLICISDITKDVLREYVYEVLEKYASRTSKRKIACVKAFFNHLEFEDVIIVNPFRKIRIPIKEPKTLPKVMQKQEVQNQFTFVYNRLKEARTEYQKYCTLRDATCYELLFSTGMRVGELCSLQKDSFDFDSGTVRILGKGGKERILYVTSPTALSTLKAYCTLRDKLGIESKYLLSGWFRPRLSESAVRYFIKKISVTSILRHVTPHMFRHTFATMLLENSVDIGYIQQILGHSSIKTTMIYLHLYNSAIRSALQTCNPRDGLTIAAK